MESRMSLAKYDTQLWTRLMANEPRKELNDLLTEIGPGEVVVVDLKGVETFDFSFANEFFGKTALSLSKEHPERFLVVENLTEYTRENLNETLEGLKTAMIERRGGELAILGKIHPAYLETFSLITTSGGAITAGEVSEKMQINITAANERLTKLVGMGLIRREKGTSETGRELFRYSTIPM